MKHFITAFCLLMSAITWQSPIANAEENKEDKVIKLIKLSGTLDVLTHMNDALPPVIIENLKAKLPSLTQDHANQITNVIQDEFRNQEAAFLEHLIPLYDDSLTVSEIEATIAFYSSKEGQAIMKKLPAIVQRSSVVAQEWGTKIGNLIAEKAVEKTIDLGYSF